MRREAVERAAGVTRRWKERPSEGIPAVAGEENLAVADVRTPDELPVDVDRDVHGAPEEADAVVVGREIRLAETAWSSRGGRTSVGDLEGALCPCRIPQNASPSVVPRATPPDVERRAW